MQAEIIAVGSELLTPSKVDTNSLYLAARLGEIGIPVVRKSVVGDDRQMLAAEIARGRKSSAIVILSGGLGPTLDDLTRDAAADATGRELVLEQSIIGEIERLFQRINRPMAAVNKRQAYLLRGATMLPNPRGTAPGQWLRDKDGILILLPGPPRELKPMFAEECLPRLYKLVSGSCLFTFTLRVVGIGESDLEQRIAPIYAPHTTVETTILSAPGDVQIHLRARAPSIQNAKQQATRLGARIHEELGDLVYSTDGKPLPETVCGLLRSRGLRLAVAESCTGGMIASHLTSVPGSSEFFAGGIVCYSVAAKTGWLGVPAEALGTPDAVSGAAARAMAEQARSRAETAMGPPAIGLATTGYAGPTGGTADDPVGTVYFGIADSEGAHVARRRFGRGRQRVRRLAVQTGLDMLRRQLLGLRLR